MTFIDPHPIRQWQIDDKWKLRLKTVRRMMAEGKRNGGILEMATPMPYTLTDERDYQWIQADIYKGEVAMRAAFNFVDFWDNSRQMFCFDTVLSEALSHTDIDDVPWSELRLPHQNFYVRWGDFGQSEYEIADFRYVVDGAYVRVTQSGSVLFPADSLNIHFTSQLVSPSYREARQGRAAGNCHFAEPVYDYLIGGEAKSTIGEAIRQGEKIFKEYCHKQDEQLWETSLICAKEFGTMPYGERIPAFSMGFERGVERFRDFVPLLFNTIFYLSERPENREERHSPNAPRYDVEQLTTAKKEKHRQSVSLNLLRRGYSIITFVRDPEVKQSAEQFFPNDRTVRAHWRRGHWRHQPFGKGLELRKWIWIKPVMVKKGEEFQVGSLHRVATPEPDTTDQPQ